VERVVVVQVQLVHKPGGTLRFIEHGLAPDERVRRWQRRIEPVNKRIFGGCHLTRPVVDLLTTAGFTITELDVLYEKGPRSSSAPTPSAPTSAEPGTPHGRGRQT
jgi:hypothetical protein